jgi:hypothetical protein
MAVVQAATIAADEPRPAVLVDADTTAVAANEAGAPHQDPLQERLSEPSAAAAAAMGGIEVPPSATHDIAADLIGALQQVVPASKMHGATSVLPEQASALQQPHGEPMKLTSALPDIVHTAAEEMAGGREDATGGRGEMQPEAEAETGPTRRVLRSGSLRTARKRRRKAEDEGLEAAALDGSGDGEVGAEVAALPDTAVDRPESGAEEAGPGAGEAPARQHVTYEQGPAITDADLHDGQQLGTQQQGTAMMDVDVHDGQHLAAKVSLEVWGFIGDQKQMTG